MPSCRTSQPARRAGLLTLVLGLTAAAWGHDFTFTDVRLVIGGDGSFAATLICDLDELALGLPPGQDSAELAARIRALPEEERESLAEGLRKLFARRVWVRFDGQPAAFEVGLPERGQPVAGPQQLPTYFGVTAELTGSAPPGARAITFQASAAFGPVELTVIHPLASEPLREALGRGARSTELVLDEPPQRPGAGRVARQYLVLGFEHIIPEGLDHVLFVVGLFLLSARWAPLLWQVTAFTLAHSITLSLAVLGWIWAPEDVIEPLIALSIAYVGVENVITRRLHPWRPIVVFAFGLMHGLGFAGVLAERGLPQGQLVPALVAFNVGVELGQLAVIAVAALLLGWFRGRPWYHARVTAPLSVLIAVVALYWTVERVGLLG